MPFDEEELDQHGECAHEIHRLKSAVLGSKLPNGRTATVSGAAITRISGTGRRLFPR